MQTLDSLGRICNYGGAWAKTETSAVYQKGFDLFGVSNILEVWMSDNSTASVKLAAIYDAESKKHVLCFQHFRQHLWDAIAAFNHADKKRFWTSVMMIMRWKGYRDDEALVQDIDALTADFFHNARCRTLLNELKLYRTKLCIFHVSKVFTMMRIASSIAESTHSAIKGGGEFKKLLRASNFYESMLHILQLMRIYIDDTVADLRVYKEKGSAYSPYVKKFIDEAWDKMAQCRSISQVADKEWRVEQHVPEFRGGQELTAYILPAYLQLHTVTFPDHQKHATCTCPEYTQGLRICPAVCAVLFQLGRGSEHSDVSQLHPRWHLQNHPLMRLVDDPCIKFHSAVQSRPQLSTDITSLSIAPNDVLRFAALQTAFEDIVYKCLKSPFFEQLNDALLQQKQRCMGQDLLHPPAFPPQPAILAVHANRGAVPETDVRNHSRLSTVYRRDAGRRVENATARDPMAYNLHKRGVHGAQIRCDCGEILINTKQARSYHCRQNKSHQIWLNQYHAAKASSTTAPDSAVAAYESSSHRNCITASPNLGPENFVMVPDLGAEGDCNASSFDVDANSAAVADESTDDTSRKRPVSSRDDGDGPEIESAVSLTLRPEKLPAPLRPKRAATSEDLPYFQEAHLRQFRINHFCENCSTASPNLCPEHLTMVPTLGAGSDYTAIHMLAMKEANFALVECGGDGDCFYHSVVFLASLFQQSLFETWQNPKTCRTLVCEHVRNNWQDIKLVIDTNGESITFAENVRHKYKAKTDLAVIKSFCASQAVCARRVRGKLISGRFVEDDIILAFAHYSKMPVALLYWERSGPHAFSCDGSVLTCEDQAEFFSLETPFKLWCNGGHYQAMVPLDSVMVRREALLSESYVQGGYLHKKDVKLCDLYVAPN